MSSRNTFKTTEELVYTMIKNIIISQNRTLFEKLEKVTDKSKEYYEHKYLKPEYYLPVMLPSPDKDE